MNYDAMLVVSFGGPEKHEDVLPFLENVLRGRNVPRERMLAVAEHYYHFDGKSPINHQTRELIAAIEKELALHGPKLPVYWGNRNWHPMLADTLRQMKADGVRRALAFVTSAYSSYSGCRQYREDIARARAEVGEGAPEVEKLRVFFNHPGFLEATEERIRGAMEQLALVKEKQESKAPPLAKAARSGAPIGAADVHLVYVAHSVPLSMATTSDYVKQLEEVRRLSSAALAITNDALVYQSRSGAPGQPWLEPDILDYLREVKAKNVGSGVVIAPISFISDHMEVLYDLDIEARQLCDSLGLAMARAKTVGVHPRFVGMIRELILERTAGAERRALGTLGARGDVCAEDCCPAPVRPVRPRG
ncbi:MAG TPA: ferrochelatase [Candidatus Eisenbacteria bacterium]|nr:ferrochelatase [Candidatus Eisenbacteria bacterium]